MTCTKTGKSTYEQLKARRERYARNLENEWKKARERARRRRQSETSEEAESRKARHREAAARYRATNRTALRIASWQRRKRIKHQIQREMDEAELDALMAEYPDAD